MGGVLSENIKQLRYDRGVTQAELSKAVGVSVQAVSKWECGGMPDVALLPAIADFFGVTIDELFGRNAEETISVEEFALKAVQHTPEKFRLKRACDIIWAVFKAFSGIPNVLGVDFAPSTDNGDPECTRCRISSDSGIAYVCALENAKSFFFFPEPARGYSSVVDSAEEYAEFFSLLSDVDIMRTLLFLYQRKAVPFSIEHICKSLGISQEKMIVCLSKIKDIGWLEEEPVELESGAKILYRPILTEAFLAFLYYSAEIRHKIRLWYMSNNSRSGPILK